MTVFVDASALVAVLLDEGDASVLDARMSARAPCFTSPLAVWEAARAISRERDVSIQDAQMSVERLLRIAEVQVTAVAPEVRHLAIEAQARFGKGRHPAALNFGDCFAYACARHAGAPLLYKGDDFAMTDIEAA
ncbi:MAG: type II toxin-antitoxin system VapC family toxin [Brevundimonas sp.]